MNKKGFTLIELLAALVILSLLMMIAVPAVLNLLSNNRKDTALEDAKKLVSAAQYKMKSNTKIKKPLSNQCNVISMEYLETSDFEEAPNGGEYDQLGSFVIIKRLPGDIKYEYYVRMVEEVDNDSYIGVSLVKYEDLSTKNSRNLINGITVPIFDIYPDPDLNALKSKIMDISYDGGTVGSKICTGGISEVYYLE